MPNTSLPVPALIHAEKWPPGLARDALVRTGRGWVSASSSLSTDWLASSVTSKSASDVLPIIPSFQRRINVSDRGAVTDGDSTRFIILEKGALERVDVRRPKRAVTRDPVVDLRESIGIERIDPSLAVLPHANQAGIAECTEVLGNRRLSQGKLSPDIAQTTRSGDLLALRGAPML